MRDLQFLLYKKQKSKLSKKSFHSQVKPSKGLNNNPVIVKNTNDKPAPTNAEILTSNVGNINEAAPFDGQGMDGLNTDGDATKNSVKSSSPVMDKSVPVISLKCFRNFRVV